jgi:AbrB family looped-hinge helix DNA binding protein
MGKDSKLAALTAKVGPKGQIVIPKEIRDMFGIEPGDTVLVLADSERGIALQPVKGNEALFDSVFFSE